MNFPPYDYSCEQLYNASFSPSTIHGNSDLARYFAKYLFEKAISPFEFTLRETWPSNYFLYTIYAWGVGCVFDAEKFGPTFQGCTLEGYNLYYQPKRAIVANPVLMQEYPARQWTMEVGKDCELIKLQPNYSGILDIISYYADMLAMFSSTLAQALVNTRFAYIFGAKNPATAGTMKKLFDDIASGQPAVFADKALFDANGNLNVELFNRDVKSAYIITDILSDMRKTESKFLTEIGIPNANTDKRERLITDEVRSNDVETRSKCEVWLETLQECFDKVNSMFDLNLSVKWRKEALPDATGYDNQPAGAV